jgi:hypothetical protein
MVLKNSRHLPAHHCFSTRKDDYRRMYVDRVTCIESLLPVTNYDRTQYAQKTSGTLYLR